jgi:hypothetical protein
MIGIWRSWKPEEGLLISLEEWKKAGFRVSHYPLHIKQLAIGRKRPC